MTANTHSITLNGSTQYLSTGDVAANSITGDLTLVAYVKLSALPSSGVSYTLLAKYGSAGQRSFWWQYANNAGTLQFSFRVSDDGTALDTDTINHTLTQGVWYQLGLIYTASLHKIEVTVNGVSVGSSTGLSTTSIFNSTADLTIGAISAPDNYFAGNIDEVQIWASARTPAQILATYGNELVGNESGLNGYWQLDNALTDSTANGQTLTNNNSATFTTDTSQVFRIVSVSDSFSMADSYTLVADGWLNETYSDSFSMTDTKRANFGFGGNPSKNAATFTNTPKS